jgi:hypothetical protein
VCHCAFSIAGVHYSASIKVHTVPKKTAAGCSGGFPGDTLLIIFQLDKISFSLVLFLITNREKTKNKMFRCKKTFSALGNHLANLVTGVTSRFGNKLVVLGGVIHEAHVFIMFPNRVVAREECFFHTIAIF